MSKKEIDRLLVLKDLEKKKIKQKEAGLKLNLSRRQISRLFKRYKMEGEKGLLSKKRGKESNRKIKKELRERIEELLFLNYRDFGPTLATEKLLEINNIKISKEYIRNLMIELGFWHPKRKNRRKIFQLRERRSRTGELIQADGSTHDWFEGRRDKCSLIVFIDDATSEIMKLKFYETETLQAYGETLQEYIHEFGLMRALYTDKHSIFKVNRADIYKGSNLTQFGRILSDLDIELITANTPQAKGRVERSNKTLQDRLVKELRLKKIDNIADANKFFDEEYIETLNNKFMVSPKESKDMHRDVNLTEEEEYKIFSLQSKRKVSKNLEISYNNVIYQLKTKYPNTIKGQEILICENFNKKDLKLFFKDETLSYNKYHRSDKMFETQSSKTINKALDEIIKRQDNQLDSIKVLK